MKLKLMVLIVLSFSMVKCGTGTYTERAYYPDGELKSEYPIVDWETHGVGAKYYRNGNTLQKSTWVNGVKEGPSRTYYHNGQIEIDAQFVNGYQSGWASYYDSLGVLKSRTFYIENKPDSFEIFYPNGTKKVLGNYGRDKANSISYHYYEDGSPYMYEVKRQDTLFYQKWYNRDGSLGGSYFPLFVTLDSSLCIQLLHSQIPSDSLKIRLYLQKIEGGYLYDVDSDDRIEKKGMKICLDTPVFKNDLVEGYLCEIYSGDNANYGCMPFRYNTRSKKLIKVIDTKKP